MTGKFDDKRARRGPPPSLAEIEALAAKAYARLPGHFRTLCEDLIIRVEDFPAPDVLASMGLASRYDLLGLFQGIGLPFRQELTGSMPNMIWLYRRPILPTGTTARTACRPIVTHVLVHEIGHHFGFSDDDMDAIEASAE